MRGAYGQWSAWLADFAEGKESDPLDSLPCVEPEGVGAIAAARICQRCVLALNQRLQHWSQLLSRDLERARLIDDLRLALGAARTRLKPLHALTTSPLLFEDLQASLQQQLQTVLDEAQAAIERHASELAGESEELLRVVRNQPLNRVVLLDLADAPTAQPSPSAARRVLIN